MEILFEQHCFTSVDPEFETIGASPGLTDKEILLLEKHSIYFLPGELLYDGNAAKPVKYVFYPLTEQRYVIGQGVYAGKDAIGRPGNYFFHNFIISAGELQKLGGNPVPLIRSLVKDGKFLSRLTGDPCVLRYSFQGDDSSRGDESFQGNKSFPGKLDKETAAALLQCVADYHQTTYPVIVHGNEHDILNLLGLFFSLLPYDQRIWLSFDTCAFGVPYSFNVMGVPEDPRYSHSVFSSMEYFTGSGKTKVHRKCKVSPVLSASVELLFQGKVGAVKKLYAAYDVFTHHPGSFINVISGVDDDFLSLFYRCFKEEIISLVLTSGNIQLLNSFEHLLGPAVYSRIFTAPGFIPAIADSPYKAFYKKALLWLLNQADPAAYGMIVKHQALWDLFEASPDTRWSKECRLPVMEMYMLFLKAMVSCYNPDIERYLLKKLLLLTKVPGDEQTLIRKRMYKIIKKFPEPEDNELIFLRMFIRIWKKKKIHKDFFSFDFTSYPGELEEVFLGFIVRSVKKKSKKYRFRIAGELKNTIGNTTSLCRYAQKSLDRYFENRKAFTAVLRFLGLLGVAEKIYLSSGGYERVKEFLEFLQT